MDRIHILSCTDRPDANALNVANHVKKIYTEAGTETKIFSLVDFPLKDVAGGRYGDKIPAVDAFNNDVLSGNGLVMVIPEYNGGFPGILKLWIDYLPFPESFENYPICLIGEAAGSFGALRPVEQIQDLIIYRKARVFPERVFIPDVNDVMDDEGDIDDHSKIKRLKKQAEGFMLFVRNSQTEKVKE